MYPLLFQNTPFAVSSWLFFYVVSSLFAYFWVEFTLKRKNKWDELHFWPKLYVVLYLSGWVGARALSIVIEQFEVSTPMQWVQALFSFGPMTFYGGALACGLTGTLAVIWKKQSTGIWLDHLIPAGILALAVGRLGCFLNGDDYGRPVDSGWQWLGFGVPGLDSEPVLRYPAPLLEAFGAFVLCGLFTWKLCLRPTPKWKNGFSGWLAILCSALLRFAVEYVRGDPRGRFFQTSLSTSQGIALVLGLSALGAMIYLIYPIGKESDEKK